MGSMLSMLIASILSTLSVATPITFATWNVDRSEGLLDPIQLHKQLKKKNAYADVYIFQEVLAKTNNQQYDIDAHDPRKLMRNFKRTYHEVHGGDIKWGSKCAETDTSLRYTMCMVYNSNKVESLKPATQAFECYNADEKSDDQLPILPETHHVEFLIQGKKPEKKKKNEEPDLSTYMILSVHLKATHWKNQKDRAKPAQEHISKITTQRRTEVNEVIDWIWLRNRFWKQDKEDRKLVILGDFNERQKREDEPEDFEPYFTGALDAIISGAKPAGSIERVTKFIKHPDKREYIFMSKRTDGLVPRTWEVTIQDKNNNAKYDHDMVGFEFPKTKDENGGTKSGSNVHASKTKVSTDKSINTARLENYDDMIGSQYAYIPFDDNVTIMEMILVLMLVVLPCAVIVACLCGAGASYLYMTPKKRQYEYDDHIV